MILVSSLAALSVAGLPAATIADPEARAGDISVGVAMDSGQQSGQASAAVRIHAPREVIWSLITSCLEAVKLVPGLVSCEVLETATDESWQRIHHVMDYSWYMPRLNYEIRATYTRPQRVAIERMSGDIARLRGSWTLESDGEFTIAHYAVDLTPGFWVPQWVVRAALKRDLPKMLRALRSRAEFVQNEAQR
jgi:hypothetical protein